MIRQRKYYGGFTKPPSESSSSDESEVTQIHSKRKANLYDAVAGRVTQAGFVGNVGDPKGAKQPLRPDEVLFKQANAPMRYEETDYYYAHAKLFADQKLPSGDLLNAIHGYISKLYSRTPGPGSDKAWKCMDETALLAFGILMEETARGVLGETGDLAFTEAADEEEERILMGEVEEEDKKRTEMVASEDERSDPWPSSGDDSADTTEESD